MLLSVGPYVPNRVIQVAGVKTKSTCDMMGKQVKLEPTQEDRRIWLFIPYPGYHDDWNGSQGKRKDGRIHSIVVLLAWR